MHQRTAKILVLLRPDCTVIALCSTTAHGIPLDSKLSKSRMRDAPFCQESDLHLRSDIEGLGPVGFRVWACFCQGLGLGFIGIIESIVYRGFRVHSGSLD